MLRVRGWESRGRPILQRLRPLARGPGSAAAEARRRCSSATCPGRPRWASGSTPEAVRALMLLVLPARCGARRAPRRHGREVRRRRGHGRVRRAGGARGRRAARVPGGARDAGDALPERARAHRTRSRADRRQHGRGGGRRARRRDFATGDAVNVAARLEQAAAPGEVLLGEPTYRARHGLRSGRERSSRSREGEVGAGACLPPARGRRCRARAAAGAVAGSPAARRSSTLLERSFGRVVAGGVPSASRSSASRESGSPAWSRSSSRGSVTRARVVRGTLPLLRGRDHLLGGRPDRARAGRDRRRALARGGAGADRGARRGPPEREGRRRRRSRSCSGSADGAATAEETAGAIRRLPDRGRRRPAAGRRRRRHPVGRADAARPARGPASRDRRRAVLAALPRRGRSCSSTVPTGR